MARIASVDASERTVVREMIWGGSWTAIVIVVERRVLGLESSHVAWEAFDIRYVSDVCLCEV